VQARKSLGNSPRGFYENDDELRAAIDLIRSGYFSHGNRETFQPLLDSLLKHDEYMVLADYRSYVESQDEVSRAFGDVSHWTRMSILNVARMGKFSSDRTIEEYCRDIWSVEPVPILNDQ
jgi:starch phosphorylase